VSWQTFASRFQIGDAMFLRLLCIPLGLAQRALANVCVHCPVLVDYSLVHGAGESSQSPVHDTVSPVRRTSGGNALCTATAANPAESCADELLGVGHEKRRLANLAHGACDEVRLNELHLDTLGFQLGAESSRPLLQESLATAVGREVGRGEDAAE
jgi:hypothetical protein